MLRAAVRLAASRPNSWRALRGEIRHMRKSLWVIALLFGAIVAPNARADGVDYTITFTTTSGTPDGTGSFTYTAGTFSDFIVTWDRATFQFTAVANGWTGGTVTGCTSGGGFFSYLTENCGGTWSASDLVDVGPRGRGPEIQGFQFYGGGIIATDIRFFSALQPNAQASGTFTTTLVPTPEPGTFGLMLLGLGLVVMPRKRIAYGRIPAD